MKNLKFVVLLVAVAGIGLMIPTQEAKAQVSVAVNFGAAPDCPYGYYDYAPYSCAPYGYFGAEWFSGGAFVGAGPWFHGPANFRGHVNNRYDVQRGYHGPAPKIGDRPEPSKRVDRVPHFKANETRDGRGSVSKGKR